MAKLAFSKFGLKTNQEIKTVEFNGQTIEVKQYLPVDQKLELISNIINLSSQEENFHNPVKGQVYLTIGLIEYYTNITFTEKQKENMPKLFDMIYSSGLYRVIYNAIPSSEIENLIDNLNNQIEAIYTYRNSVMGILDIVSSDYSNLDLEASDIQQKIADPNNMALLKNILTKLG